MFKFYIDKEHNIAWLTSFRNGSTMLENIASLNSNLLIYKFADIKLHNYLKENPNAPIYTVFRDPEVRFRSGLKAVFHKISNGSDNYNSLLNYIKNVIERSMPFRDFGRMNAVNHRIFYLFDSHLDHTLWAPMTLATYGHNIKLIPMNEYSGYLNCYYPKEYSAKSNNIRSDSFDTSTAAQNALWDSYKEIMFNNNELTAFDQWMSVEKQIFEMYKNNYKQDNIKEISKELMQIAINDPLYFTDIYSTRVDLINRLLEKLHMDDTETSKYPLYEYNQSYFKIKQLAVNFMNNNRK